PRSHPSGAQAGPLLRKVPRVSLERLELDLAGAAQPPAFRVFPGTSAKDFSLIVIERGAQPRPPGPVAIKVRWPLAPPGPPSLALCPTSLSFCVCPHPSVPVPLSRSHPSLPHCYHLDCHLPPLQEVPSPEWRCLLCQDLPAPGEELTAAGEAGPPDKLCPLDQQKCEYVLLELLCHEPCRPLHRLSSSLDGHDAIDLTLIRAKLQEKLSPHY
ncbi:TIF1B factor, partial [Caloenas nicobarica]|nr:TIF1B factor [Caloenas nicobarica]